MRKRIQHLTLRKPLSWQEIILFILISCSSLWQGRAQEGLYHIVGPFTKIDLTGNAALFVDSSGTKRVEDIRNDDSKFVRHYKVGQSGEYPVTHWLKVTVVADSAVRDAWLVLKNDMENYAYHALNDYVDVYYLDGPDSLRHYRTGFLTPRKDKAIPAKSSINVLPFSATAGDTVRVLLRVRNMEKHFTAYLGLELRNSEAAFPAIPDGNKWIIYGSFGTYTIIGLYVLFFFFYVRDNAYLFYALYCLTTAVHYQMLQPYGSFIEWWTPNHPTISLQVFTLAGSSYIWLLLFGRSFADVKKRFPKWDYYFLFLIVFLVVAALWQMFFNFSAPYDVNLLFIPALVLLIPLCVRLMMSPFILARIFAIGFFWLVLWNAIGVLGNMELIEPPFNPWPVGQQGVLLVFGLGLGIKFQQSEKEKAAAERIRELDEIKSRFFANISHEFRTPLSLILGPVNQAVEQVPASEALTDEVEVPITGRQLDVMKRNALRLQHLIDQLLDLSKLENGRMQLQVRRGKLIEFLRALVFSFESLAERKRIHLQVAFPEERPDVWFDADKVEKIVANLLSNAFKYTPTNGKVKVQAMLQSGILRFSVSDSGPGVASDDLDKIFDRFYRVEGTEETGSGIGLSLVKEMVELHKGQIRVESIQGQGATFQVSIPVQASAYTEEEKAGAADSRSLPFASPEAREAPEPNESFPSSDDDGAPPIALIVEDHPDLRGYLSEILGREFTVIRTADGREGLKVAVDRVPDIVISDVRMPEMNGMELCHALKTNDVTSHIPVILLTAKAERADKLRGLRTGADDYLTKPFDARELLVRTRNLIAQRRQLREKFAEELVVGPAKLQLNSVDERFLKRVMEAIERNIDNEFFSVEELATKVGFSRSQLNRKLKALCEKTPNEMIRDFRLARAKEMLEQRAASVSEVAYQVGYSNLSYFSRSFKKAYGVLPSEV